MYNLKVTHPRPWQVLFKIVLVALALPTCILTYLVIWGELHYIGQCPAFFANSTFPCSFVTFVTTEQLGLVILAYYSGILILMGCLAVLAAYAIARLSAHPKTVGDHEKHPQADSNLLMNVR